ncbi:Protein of unknown function [Leuconostoc citreum LBAE E16]|nr:Protein of unknown function [Leuconostoc citreum LBAE E16]
MANQKRAFKKNRPWRRASCRLSLASSLIPALLGVHNRQ